MKKPRLSPKGGSFFAVRCRKNTNGPDRDFQKKWTGCDMVGGIKEHEGVRSMIEIIYNESKKGGSSVVVKPPKNIRQIGSPKGRHKIYVEDYVYTFLHSSAFEGISQKRAAVLLGKSEVSQDIRYTFISGAVSCEDFVFQEDGILFDESCWEYIYKEIKQYFDQLEIVGWFLGLTGFPLELTPAVEAAHRKYFAGRDKVLFLSEPAEGEDVFFAYEQGSLQKKEGYYIYYEKNLSMQEYMICTRENAREREGGIESSISEKSGETIFWEQTENIIREEVKEDAELTEQSAETAERSEEPVEQVVEASGQFSEEYQNSPAEQALRRYRNALQERQGMPSPRKMNGLLYIAASAAMVILCVIGITTMNNYEKMKQVEQALAVITRSSGQEEEKEDVQAAGVIVESVPGEVSPEQPAEEPSGEEQQSGVEQQSGEEQPTEEQENQTTENQAAESQATENQAAGGQQEEQQSPETTEAVAQEDAQAAALTYLEQGYYIVQPGDKLELICKNIYQTTAMMDKLCEANQIEDVDKIYAGQKLVLP